VLDVIQADRREGLEVVEDSPQEVLRDLFAALARCDLRALDDLVAEDAVWHVPGTHPFAGDHVGKDAVLALAARMQELTAELLFDVDEVVAANSHVAVVGSVWGDRDGKILFGNGEVAVFRVEGAKVVEGWTYVFDTPEVDRFWS
jgi:ketosteroid isomerase-like protein